MVQLMPGSSQGFGGQLDAVTMVVCCNLHAGINKLLAVVVGKKLENLKSLYKHLFSRLG